MNVSYTVQLEFASLELCLNKKLPKQGSVHSSNVMFNLSPSALSPPITFNSKYIQK